jgi:uncharacterized protein GlcG (DUF336 family)
MATDHRTTRRGPARRRAGALLGSLLLAACGGGGGGGGGSGLVTEQANLEQVVATAPPVRAFLTATDVNEVVRRAAEALDATTMVIAVVDRAGIPLAVFRKPDAPVTVTGNFGVQVDANDLAVALARTGAFFSNNQAPLSSRTVRFISGIHFPPGVSDKPNAPLYGIENTNRGCPLVTPGAPAFNPDAAVVPALSVSAFRPDRTPDPARPCHALNRTGCGLGIATGKADLVDGDATAVNPGGIPIFKDGELVGGVGVTGVPPAAAEFAAFVASVPAAGFGPVVAPPGVIFLDGVELPFVNQATRPPGFGPGAFVGTFVLAPTDSPAGLRGVPTGWLVGPAASSELSVDDVRGIVGRAVAQAERTRAAIRLPLGSTTRMVIGVSDLEGRIIGLFRMPDATVFSIDVAATKARNVVYFSAPTRPEADLPGVPPGTAVTNRTISFGAQPLYPPGIDGTSPGPFFPLYLSDVATPCSQGSQAANLNQSGIVFFPGSMPLYRDGRLVGGLGVSGDGVEQDDLVAAAGATGLAPPEEIRADRIEIRGARLPFLKFPRNPEQR